MHRPQAQKYFRLFPYYATYTSNWVVAQASVLAITWSLATEEQFYLLWPACEKVLRNAGALADLREVLGTPSLAEAKATANRFDKK